MNKLDGLIVDGKQLIEEYYKAPQESYGRVRGIKYETWMGKVKMFVDTELKGNSLKNELEALYKKRNNYLGTTAVEKVIGVLCALQSADVVEGEKREMKIFISHSSNDKNYGDVLVELLRGIGLKKEEIIYTSNDIYGIPLRKNIYDYLRNNINDEIHMIFLLSTNYFNSVACLNEMGASWLAQKEHTIIGVPQFDFNMKQFSDCCLDSKEMGFNMNNNIRVTEFKAIIETRFGKRIDDMEWQSVLEKYNSSLYDLSAL